MSEPIPEDVILPNMPSQPSPVDEGPQDDYEEDGHGVPV